MRKGERNSKVSNAPITAQGPTLIHRFVRWLVPPLPALSSAVSREEKTRRRFPSLAGERTHSPPRRRERSRMGERCSGCFDGTGSVPHYFSCRPALKERNHTIAFFSSFFLRRQLRPDPQLSFAASERADTYRVTTDVIIYRRCNLNNSLAARS